MNMPPRREARNIQELFHALCSHLLGGSATTSTTEDFAKLETNQERVGFVSELLEKFKLLPREGAESLKNDKRSKLYREMGNDAFKAKKDGEALDKYTKSVAYATSGSEELGLAFANRSAVLFERKMYRECLKDIENALANNYPPRLLTKLETRRSKAESLLNKQNSEKYFFDLPKLSSPPNPLIQCASDSVEIKDTELMGRHVVATKDISPGDVIALERPFAKILLRTHLSNHCYHCLALCYNLIPCPQCTRVLFCSKICLDEAAEQYHEYECPILHFLYMFEFSNLELLALRVTLRARPYYKTLDQCFKESEIYRSERYEEIHNLVTNTEKRKVSDLFKKAMVAAVLTYLLEKHTTLMQEDIKGIFSDLLFRHLQTGPSNFHEISEIVGSADKCYTPEQIGSGAFSFLSLFNHSCSPNVVRHCHGSTVVLRALRPVRKGEQLFDNYGYHHALMTKQERQDQLKKQYFFECNCEACREDWPLYHDSKSLESNLEIDSQESQDVEALRAGSVDTARAMVGNLIEKLKELEETIPSRNLADAQEIIKQCFALFGNKRTIL